MTPARHARHGDHDAFLAAIAAKPDERIEFSDSQWPVNIFKLRSPEQWRLGTAEHHADFDSRAALIEQMPATLRKWGVGGSQLSEQLWPHRDVRDLMLAGQLVVDDPATISAGPSAR